MRIRPVFLFILSIFTISTHASTLAQRMMASPSCTPFVQSLSPHIIVSENWVLSTAQDTLEHSHGQSLMPPPRDPSQELDRHKLIETILLHLAEHGSSRPLSRLEVLPVRWFSALYLGRSPEVFPGVELKLMMDRMIWREEEPVAGEFVIRLGWQSQFFMDDSVFQEAVDLALERSGLRQIPSAKLLMFLSPADAENRWHDLYINVDTDAKDIKDRLIHSLKLFQALYQELTDMEGLIATVD